jgi:transmembrane sensor
VVTGASETHAPVEMAQPAQEYDGVAVADLIDAANRSSAQPIRLAETAIGQRRVSGRFRLDDTALLAQRLALLFDLNVDRSHPEEIVLRVR